MRKHKLIIAALAVGLLAACSSAGRSSFCAGTTAGGFGLGVFNPFAIPCLVNDVTEMVSNRSATADKQDDSLQSAKSFQASPKLMKDIWDNGEVMQFVVSSQERYKAGDYGTATEEQKKSAIGQYAAANLGKTIVIKDEKTTFRVSYNDE